MLKVLCTLKTNEQAKKKKKYCPSQENRQWSCRSLDSSACSLLVPFISPLFPTLGLEESILSKWLYYPRQSGSTATPIKLAMAFFTEDFFLICMWTRKTSKTQSNPKNNEQRWKNQAPWLRLYYKAAVIKTAWYWHTHTYTHTKHHGEKTVSSVSGARETGQLHVKEWNQNIL